MRRVAANIVYINNIEFYKNYIVELYEHIVVNRYQLKEELEMTEWLGGTILLYKRKAYHVNKVLSPEEANVIYSTLSSSSEFSTDYSGSYGNIKRL